MIMLNTKEEFIYFDIENEVNTILKEKYKYKNINRMTSISTSGNRKKIQEIVFWNF